MGVNAYAARCRPSLGIDILIAEGGVGPRPAGAYHQRLKVVLASKADRDGAVSVACIQCQHRATLGHDQIDGFSENMKAIRTPSFRCTVRGSVANRLYLFHNRREVDDFLADKAEW